MVNQSTAFLTAREAAELLGVKVQTLYAYVSRGLLHSHPGPGRRRRYLRGEVERLRDGPSRVAESLRWGEPLIESEVSWIGPEGPVYRGRQAVDLLHQPFEAVAELLWSADLPEPPPRWSPAPRPASVRLPEVPSISGLMLLVAALAADDPARFSTALRASLPRARRTIAAMAAVGASGAEGRVASRLAESLGVEASEEVVVALDRALVLVADHELNASTFAVRVVASTGADLYASLGAGLAALSGPRHGGAGERVGALLDEIGAPGRAGEVVLRRLRRGERVPGFGHPLYPHGDPRAAPLLDSAARLQPEAEAVRICAELEEAAAEAGLGRPNLDLGLAALVGALGLPWTATGFLFAVGRSAGWVAHALEQHETGVLIRPRARRARVET